MFRRGFKSWCERTALEKRTELNLRPLERLEPVVLAQHLGIDVRKPSEIPGVSDTSLRQLLHNDPGGWSAVTLRTESVAMIILNTSHSPARQASDLMHELAHVLLGHTPSRVDVTEALHLLLRTHDRGQEEEANWLGGCLLLPRPVLLAIQRSRQSPQDAARHYGVSVEMVNYRLRVSGALIQARRSQVR